VFVGPIEIAGHYSGLAAALRTAGVDAVAVDIGNHPFAYEDATSAPRAVRLAARVIRSRERARWWPSRVAWLAAELISRSTLLLWSLGRFDAFIFSHGHTIWFGRELPLLRLLRRPMVFVFNGSDARPPYVDGAIMAKNAGRTIQDCIRLTARAKSRIKRIERHASAIVSQPAFSHFFERPVADFFRMGVPWSAGPAPTRGKSDAEIRVLHSPSRPDVKGTDRIREAVAHVRARGVNLRLIELQGVRNSEVRAEIARADFVIDQVYSDAPMVSFATEAATIGVPAIVGGYAWPELNRIYSGDAMPPVEQCHPDDLEAAIERLATDGAYRRALGHRAKQFISQEWSPVQIASRYLGLLRGEKPPSLMYDPASVRYLCGVGLAQDDVRALVAETIEVGGLHALQLHDKPRLAAAFASFARGESGCEAEDRTTAGAAGASASSRGEGR
jgi:hypothetical protein